MCPLCIGSVLLTATGASFSGGLTLLAARLLGPGSPKHAAQGPRPGKPAGRNQASAGRSLRTPEI
jgi:hypothetical protein